MQSRLAMPATRHEQEPPGSSQTWLEEQWPASLAPRCWFKLLNLVIHLESPHSGWNTTGWLLKSPPFPSFSPACSLQPPWAAPHWLAMAAKNRKTSPAETFVGLFCITTGVKNTHKLGYIFDPYSYGSIYIQYIIVYPLITGTAPPSTAVEPKHVTSLSAHAGLPTLGYIVYLVLTDHHQHLFH